MLLFTQEQASQMKPILPARRHATQAKRFNCHLSGCLVLRLSAALTRGPLMLATNTHGMKTHYGEMLTDKTPSAAILLSHCIMRRPERRKDISPVKLPPCNWVVCVSWQLSRQPNTFPYDSHCEVLTPNKNKVIERKKSPLMNMLVGTPFSSVCLSLCLSICLSPLPLSSRQQQSPKAVGNDVESSWTSKHTNLSVCLQEVVLESQRLTGTLTWQHTLYIRDCCCNIQVMICRIAV